MKVTGVDSQFSFVVSEWDGKCLRGGMKFSECVDVDVQYQYVEKDVADSY